MLVNVLFLELVPFRDENEYERHPPGTIPVPFMGLFKISNDHPLTFMGVPPGWNALLVNVFLSLPSPPFKWIFINPFYTFQSYLNHNNFMSRIPVIWDLLHTIGTHRAMSQLQGQGSQVVPAQDGSACGSICAGWEYFVAIATITFFGTCRVKRT